MESMLRKLFIVLPSLVLALSLGCGGSNTTTSGPTITSFTPTGGGVGTLVTVYGSGFTGTKAVTVCGVAVDYGTGYTDNKIVSDTEITFDVPLTVTTTGSLSITNASGTTTTAQLFDVTPTISSRNPTSGHVGTPVFIHGYGLLGVTNVMFGSVSAPIISASTTASQLLVDVPTTGVPTGSVTITLQNDYGLGSASTLFTVN